MNDNEFHVMAWPLAAMSFIVHRHLQNLEGFLGDHGLTVPMWRVLNALADRDGLSIRDVASHAALDAKEIRAVVRQMEADDLVSCESAPNDRANITASLTKSGRAAFAKILPTVKFCHEQSLNGINDEEFDALLRLLGKVQTNVYETKVGP